MYKIPIDILREINQVLHKSMDDELMLDEKTRGKAWRLSRILESNYPLVADDGTNDEAQGYAERSDP
jgi:hypothetical protein